MEKVSVVFPVWNEAGNLPALYHEVTQACQQACVDYELVFVDDGSSDESLAIIKRLSAQDPRVTYLSLSRNFGHQSALFAGMSHATGDAVITMDADLQHPPSLVPQMIDRWRQGAQVVYTTKTDVQVPPLTYWAMKLFYWLISRVSELRLEFGQSDFRLLDRKALDVLLQLPEYHKFLRGQVQWLGFRQAGLPYSVPPRHSGRSKSPYRKRLTFALDGLVAFSRYPLHMVTLLAMGIATFAALYIGWVFILFFSKLLGFLANIPLPSGWATLAVAVFFLGSVQLVVLGVLAEYIGRIYDQAKGRPIFIVQERGGAGRHADEGREFAQEIERSR